MLCDVMLCYVMLYYVMLCYVMLCYVMLCYVMLCYVMLCYVIYKYSLYTYYMGYVGEYHEGPLPWVPPYAPSEPKTATWRRVSRVEGLGFRD